MRQLQIQPQPPRPLCPLPFDSQHGMRASQSPNYRQTRANVPTPRLALLLFVVFWCYFAVLIRAHNKLGGEHNATMSLDRATAMRSNLVADDDGWKMIPVFVGKSDIYEKSSRRNHNPAKEWYGQFHQDIMVSNLLRNKTNGFFVDLAANHPTFLSSTYSLERRLNWSGICIEPNSDHWWGLSQARNCQLVGAVIGQRKMDEVNFRIKNVDKVGGHGGIIGKGMKNENAPSGDGESFYTVTLDETLRRVKAPHRIDFLSLDVEGAEEFVMRGFPFNDYHISLLNVENAKPSLQSLLVEKGFRMVARLGHQDSLWAHVSAKNTLAPDYLLKYRNTLRTGDPELPL